MGFGEEGGTSRRRFLTVAGTATLGSGLGVTLHREPIPLLGMTRERADLQRRSMRIGIIGSGRQGGAIGLLWAAAGHEVLFSSRHPEELSDLVQRAGARASAGFPQEAATFGEVVLIAVPYGALPQVGRDHAPLMRNKVVIECGNPRADRDGLMANEAIAKGTGVASAEYLPGVRLVCAFNSVTSRTVEEEAHRSGEKVGIPVVGDDADAVEIAVRLVKDAGFDPVVVGPLARAREFDRGTRVYVTGMTAAELRQALSLR